MLTLNRFRDTIFTAFNSISLGQMKSRTAETKSEETRKILYNFRRET